MGFSAAKPAKSVGRTSAAAAFVAPLAALLLGCNSGSPPPEEPDDGQKLAPLRCAQDQAREFQCEAFLPLGTTLSAPEPYQQCPIAMDIAFSAYPTESNLARFDSGYTQYIRRRSAPGHNCCYSWCSTVTVADPALVSGATCRSPLAFTESYCLTEFEGGSSGPVAAPPFDRCPAAIVPPSTTSFSVPPAAALDHRMTTARRQLQRPECCYSWCSIAPAGSGLEKNK